MKTFLTGVIGGLLGLLLGLLAYDHFIAQPREARLLASMHAMFEDASKAWPDVNAQREEAVRIAAELEASVARSVEGAREALAGEAAAGEKRTAIADGLARASALKLVLTEHYLSMGAWPTTADEVGMSEQAMQGSGTLKAISIGPKGTLEISYASPLPAAATIQLIPSAHPSGSIEWRCEATGFDDRSLLPAQCR